MVPTLNNEYMEPLRPVYPAHRLGALGDSPKAMCSTCHQGVNKPLYGVSMLEDYPVWRAPLSPETTVAPDYTDSPDYLDPNNLAAEPTASLGKPGINVAAGDFLNQLSKSAVR
jgi:hypothetical protein